MDLLIFDLDGTLIDSKLDLAHAVNATRAHLGYPALEHDTVYSYVGNGAPTLIRRALGPGAADAAVEQGLAFFLNYYRDHMVDYTVLYPGVPESLARIADARVKMAVLTNKPVRISVAILDALGVGNYFQRVYGGNSFEQKKPHPVGIETLLSECGAERSKTMMVGDSAVDIETARNARVRSCGVTYGFQPETLIGTPPDLLVDRIEQLADWVIGNG
ncbi:MAG: HAD-IA family hydrolase [Bryobacteraceae bacterium]